MTPPRVLHVHELTKTYTTFRKDPGFAGAIKSLFTREIIPIQAVKSTSFSIKKGEFVGLLGPNGAGKTTILKMLTGLIPPSSGQATAFESFDTSKRAKAYLRRIGMVMGQRNQLHPDLPAMDSFRLSQAIYDISDERFQSRLKQCLDLFEIHHKVDVPVRKLSLGERMKMELILAILHEPELLFLDEPTIGLDFAAAKQIRKFLAEANEQLGITIVLTSHYTKDIEELCRRVILINHGKMIYDGPLTGLDTRIQGERQFSITLHSDAGVERLQSWMTRHPEIEPMVTEDNEAHTVQFSVPAKHVFRINHDLTTELSVKDIKDVLISERPLEEIFAELYQQQAVGGPIRDAEVPG